jgi:phenylalanine-4-hydroxylase
VWAPEGAGSSEPGGTRARVPPHLRRFVVEQNYAEYNSVDQAVWRFVLTQIYDTLRHTAHPAYEQGLANSGIDRNHIPRIEEMDSKLSEYGWGAVCVDGFIPPRAFVEFQALGILPIAADIRTRRHLVYTPAPDIIHEAAGHAPILPDPAYAAYLKRIGRVGSMAFSSREDERVYRAIFRLSEVKERPEATASEISGAEREFEEAVAAVTRTTEAARMSRLYWWTAEYGLVGTPSDYKLYGAGLLSSLGESHSCHNPSVRKLPLSLACLDTPYEITHAQPQLFVARDFAHLEEVLEDAAGTLAAFRGGPEAAREAERSGEVATVSVGADLGRCVEILGIVQGYHPARGLERLRIGGRWALASQGLLRLGPEPLAPERGGAESWLEVLAVAAGALGPWLEKRGDTVHLETAGVAIEGVVRRVIDAAGEPNGPPLALLLEEARLGDEFLPNPTVLAPGRVLSARAGASDPGFYSASLFPGRMVPEPRRFDDAERALMGLYEQADALARDTWGSLAARTLRSVHDALRRKHPEEWLLRWRLLELLVRHDPADPEAEELQQALERLEIQFQRAEPIALGLRYLARLGRAR